MNANTIEHQTPADPEPRAPIPVAELAPAYAAYCAHQALQPEGQRIEPAEMAVARFDRAYCGHYDSPAAWAREVAASTGLDTRLAAAIPDWLHPHVHIEIDYDDIARVWIDTGEVHLAPDPAGGIWVFDLRV